MGYYVSNIIGIRTGGVFSADVDVDDIATRIVRVAGETTGAEHWETRSDLAHSLSSELTGNKGSWVVIAGVFNYWHYEQSSEFARALSAEFQTEVMHICWDEEAGKVDHAVWLAGKPLPDVNEDWLSRTVRRVGG